MSLISWKQMTVAAATGSFLLVSQNAYVPSYVPLPTQSYGGSFMVLFLLQFVAGTVWAVILYPKYFSPIRHLPQPEGGSMFMGQFSKIRSMPSGAPAREWVNSIPNNGLIRYLGMFNEERILIASTKALGEVLTTKSYDWIKPKQVRAGIGRILGIGVLLAEGEEHKAQRKNLMPAFAFRHIKDLYPLFWDKSRECVEAMSAEIHADAGKSNDGDVEKSLLAADQAVMEVGEWASRVTLDIIGVAGIGQDFGAIKDPNTTLFRTYNKVFKPNRQAQLLGLLGLFFPTWLVRKLPIKRNGEIEEAAANIRQLCSEVIRSKKQKLEKKELHDVDILSVALESGGFTDENLVDQLMTFLAAGHETTASAMTWAVYMLCLNPSMQTRLRAEVRAGLPSPSSGKTISSTDIDNRLPYLHAVCNEVLRYYPPVPMTIREAAHDTTIVGEFVPKGTRIFIVPWATNRDKSLWGEDAATFNPDRWLADPSDPAKRPHVANGGAASNYSLLTFLHGPRSCMGMAFSKAEFACLLASWVGRFEFELADVREMDEKNMVIKGGVTARPAKGLNVKVRVVDGW